MSSQLAAPEGVIGAARVSATRICLLVVEAKLRSECIREDI
jgi:hypothetical protein